MVLEAKSNV